MDLRRERRKEDERLHNEENKEDEKGRHVARMGELRNPYKILDGKPEEMTPHGRTRHR
jgi:hypothetical protein